MTAANRSKKRRQHYVWQHYLKGWTIKGKLWCCRDGSAFPVSVQNVAHERDFYRLREMTERDLQIVRQIFIDPLPPVARDVANGWIPYFTEFFRIKREYEKSGVTRAEVMATLDATINDLEEDLHAHLENKAQPFLAALRAKDESLVQDDKLTTNNVWFIAAQYFRTPRMMKRLVAVMSNIPQFNAEASFGLIRTIATTNVGGALWVRRSGLRMTFLHATSGSAFITGDQPIINTRAIGLELEQPPEELELYYPLLPTLGVLFDFDAGVKEVLHRTLTPDEVGGYNQMIREMSSGQVYGSSSGAVAPEPNVRVP